MDDVPKDEPIERGQPGERREERRWKSEDKPGEPLPHSPALYMFESAVADEGQPLPPRSTSTAHRRGTRGCEKAKKRRRAEPIVRADRPASGSMRTSA